MVDLARRWWLISFKDQYINSNNTAWISLLKV